VRSRSWLVRRPIERSMSCTVLWPARRSIDPGNWMRSSGSDGCEGHGTQRSQLGRVGRVRRAGRVGSSAHSFC
jgi:hypothetical protein